MPDTQQLLEKSWAFVLAHSEKFLTFANNFADRSLQPLIAVVKSGKNDAVAATDETIMQIK